MIARRWAIAALLLAAAWACDRQDAGTQIIVAVDSNLSLGDELAQLDIRVFERDSFLDGEELRMTSIAVGPLSTEHAHPLPLTFSLEAEAPVTDRAFRLVITGLGPDRTDAVAEAQVITAFQPGKVLRLDVYLSRTCLQTLCRQGSRRTDTTCERAGGSCAAVRPRTDLARATDEATAGYTPVCDVPPLCVDGQLRSCSADGTREEYAPCPEIDDPCLVSVCEAGRSACVQQRAPDAPPTCREPDAGRCGGIDRACCERAPACVAGTCVDGFCRACGRAGEPCCGAEQCGDGDPCNGDERCVAGTCQAGTPLSCSDSQGCTDDRCTPMVGCTHTVLADESPCDDADGCTRDDRCRGGLCVGGAPLVCMVPTPICADGACVTAPSETCDGGDDDRDGTVDEDTTRACYMGPPATRGIGACRDGMLRCVGGSYGMCDGEVTPASEVCNGTDDDCDGATDEETKNACGGCAVLSGVPGTPCGNGQAGGCAREGKRVCSGIDAVACDAISGMAKAEICNGSDDDCDGATDEAIAVQCFETSGGEQLPGTPGTGACKLGVKTCMSGVLGPCVGAVGASAEVCGDDRDDDCDGSPCSLHAITLYARRVDDYATVRSVQREMLVCEGAGFDCDLRAFVLAQPDRSDEALRGQSFTVALTNRGCGATEGSFHLEIDGTRHDLPSQQWSSRTHCGITHRFRFTVDFIAGTLRLDEEERCPFLWSCTD